VIDDRFLRRFSFSRITVEYIPRLDFTTKSAGAVFRIVHHGGSTNGALSVRQRVGFIEIVSFSCTEEIGGNKKEIMKSSPVLLGCSWITSLLHSFPFCN
jgi:hypothetical protein